MKLKASVSLLLVEDEALISMNNTIFLQKYGYKVHTALSAEEAFEIIEHTDIDLVLMDIDLGAGKMDGIEAASIITSKFDIPIIFLSSHTEADIVEKSERVASFGYLAKGTSVTLINNSIQTALRLKELRVDQNRTAGDIEQTQLMFKDVLNTIPIRVFWKDLNSVYLGCNSLFAQDSGKKRPEEIVGLTDFEIRTAEQAELNQIDDKKIIKSGKQYINNEEPLLTKDGQKNWIMTSKMPLSNSKGKTYGILGFYENITERKKMKEELLLQKNRLANILYGSNVGTWEWNVQTGENIVNEHWVSIIGYTLKELSSKQRNNWKEFIHPDDLKVTNLNLEDHFSKKKDYFEYEFRMRHKQGHWVWVLSRGKVVSWTEDGKPFLVSGTHLDVNERRLAEEEVLRQLAEKEIILKEVHHRIKNNFAVIGSFLSLQADLVSNKEAVDALQDAIGRVYSMQSLYEKLLLADDFQNTSSKNYIEDLIENIINVFPDRSDIKVVKQICNCELKPKQLFSLGIIVNELITNVMKYAFTDRDTGLIHISLQEDADRAILTVSDNGVGLPTGFDDNKTSGFGIMLINILTQQLGGEFTIENSNGTKSTLIFNVLSE